MSFRCSSDCVDHSNSFCYACLPSGIFQRFKGLHNGTVLVASLFVAIMKDLVVSFEEQIVHVSMFA